MTQVAIYIPDKIHAKFITKFNEQERAEIRKAASKLIQDTINKNLIPDNK